MSLYHFAGDPMKIELDISKKEMKGCALMLGALASILGAIAGLIALL